MLTGHSQGKPRQWEHGPESPRVPSSYGPLSLGPIQTKLKVMLNILRRIRLGIPALVFASVAMLPAQGAVLFSNLGPGDTFNTASGNVIDNNQYVASNFTASETASITSLRLALRSSSASAFDLIVSLRSPGSFPTGSVLESWTISGSSLSQSTAQIETLISLTNPLLTSGETYWIRLESQVASPSRFVWHMNSTGDQGIAISQTQGTSWLSGPFATAPAFEVNGSAVPEPSAALLLIGGLSMLGVHRARLHRARQGRAN
jgi:hypothetical protein